MEHLSISIYGYLFAYGIFLSNLYTCIDKNIFITFKSQLEHFFKKSFVDREIQIEEIEITEYNIM